MQEGYFDYTQDERNTGCCLYCDDSHEGCLCYDCKCKKCYWYNEEGFCEYVQVLKEEGRIKAIEFYKRQEEIEHKKGQTLIKNNEIRLKKIKEKKKIPFYYTCQKCNREFVSEKELKIVILKEPICELCSNKLEVGK